MPGPDDEDFLTRREANILISSGIAASAAQLDAHRREHEAEQKAVITAIAAVDRERVIHAEAHARSHAAHDKEHMLERQALDKADESMNLRLLSMNEFRQSLRDQADTLARKEALDALTADVGRRFDDLSKLIATEREERRANEGVKRGMGQTTTVIVAAIGLVGTVLGIVIILSNILTAVPK